MENEEKQPIIFGYYVNNILKGFRADSFGTLSMDSPKIYSYSEKQVNIILENARDEMNASSSRFLKMLFNENTQPYNMEGQALDKDKIIRLVENREKEKKWEEFELHVIPFINYEEGYIYPEKWKIEAALASLQEPLEIHKFKTIDNQN